MIALNPTDVAEVFREPFEVGAFTLTRIQRLYDVDAIGSPAMPQEFSERSRNRLYRPDNSLVQQ
jgi:hypothetical protein